MTTAFKSDSTTMAESSDGKIEFSSEEFQRKLFDWFDQRGLLSELRTFMRHRMISALYSSDSPCTTPATGITSESIVSPTLQALLLLVAEFLVQQEYHYTISVMVAEVPLLASLPKFSQYVSFMSNVESVPLKKAPFPRYSDPDLKEILEFVGILPDSESSQHIHRLYNNNGARESLLACILTALAAIAQHSSLQIKKPTKAQIQNQNSSKSLNNNEFTKWLEEIRLVLLRAPLTSLQLQQVEKLLWDLYSDTVSKVQRDEQEEYKNLLQEQKRQFQANALLHEERFQTQVELAENDLRKKQVHLQQVTIQLRQQHDEVLNRLNRVQKHADEIQRQESDLIKREKKLEQKEKLLEKEQHVLADLQQTASSIQHETSDTKAVLELGYLQERCSYLEAQLKEAKAQLQASAVLKVDAGIQVAETTKKERSEVSPDIAVHHQQPSSTSSTSSFSFSICGSATKPANEKSRDRSNQVTLLKRVLRRVQQENSELRANASQQRRRIDELTARAAQLAAHIAALGPAPGFVPQTRAELPTPHHGRSPTPLPRPPPPPPPPAPRHSRHGVQVGAGGDLTQPGASPRHTGNTLRLQGREWRRKPPKRLLQHTSLTTSLSSDDSPTEEVLREARNRLRRLEEESEIVDRRYRDFRARQADNLVSTASLLFVPTQDSQSEVPHPITETLNSVSAGAPGISSLSSLVMRSPGNPTFSPAAVVPSPFSSSVRGWSGMTFPTFPQSQFTLPERSAYSSSINRTSLRHEDAIPHRPSVLRRPSERMKDLLSTQAHLLKNFASVGEPPCSQPARSETYSRAADASNDAGILESVADSRVVRTAETLQDLHLTGRTINAAEKARNVTPELNNISVRDGSSYLSPHESPSKSIVSTLQPSLPVQSNQHFEDSKIPSDPLLCSPKNIQTTDFDAPSKRLSSPPPPPQRVESLSSQDDVPIPCSSSRPSPIEKTLNKVSTFSSSSPTSAVIVGNIQTDLALAPTSPTFESTTQNAFGSSAVIHEVNNAESYIASTTKHSQSEKFRVIPNASLSSIEMSDQAISIGSDSKKTDDDDFW